ncbi:hypothetical protein GBA63_01125 [Rubrobacter tropicus]|uniref:GH29D-like beta-sandwich domain-containing protein n=1 Tax=Rubrobacter tropicus TaxID=2653851 RepID=A0A6G8Q4K4_9ACTN|nr:chitobiase/beta-hexosaminidase C-terminal domain-containing protein [Rubrobacter tropicus]QIN81380.1 hypothetical protein GBA63_01125 [Rubrobacter tropicus]
MGTQYGNIFERGRRLKKLVAISATALLVSLPLAAPAQALPTGPGIQPGHNITVFHNLDFIAVFGYQVGEELTVQVFRGDHMIGTATGPAVEADEGLPQNGALEVNHGPEGDPQPGDCWENFTPDILPGDRVVVTSAAGTVTEEVTVDGISMKAPKDDTSTADPSDVIVEGRASFADGTPIPVDRLDSGELRQASPRFRAAPSAVERIPGTTDGWRAIYRAPYDIVQMPAPLTAQQQKDAILNGDHAMGYGHVAPLPAETQLVDGVGGGGPALGCEALAPKQSNAVATSDDENVNIASDTLNLSGTAMEDVSGVDITLGDGDAATTDPTVSATNLAPGPGGEQTWSAQFSRADLDALSDGTLTATGAYALSGGGTTTGATLELQKDTVAPGPATSDVPPGIYNTDKSVTLSAEAGAKVRYTTDGTDPSATTGALYDGQQINVTSSQTIKAIVVDAAGNPSSVASFGYTIDRVAPSLTSNFVSGSYDAAQMVPFTSDDPGAEIRYTTDGSTPNRTSKLYTGPVRIAKTQTVKAVAYDAAGNASGVQSRTVTIRKATTTNLNVPTADMKLGNTRAIAGGVSPNQAGSFVRVTIDRPGTLSTITRSATLNEFSRFSTTYKPTAPGTYRITASFVKDADALASTSVMKSFRVVR